MEITVDAIRDRTFEGRVKAVSPTGNPDTRTFRVWVRVDNPAPHPLLSGMSGRARVVRAAYDGVYLLPEPAVLKDEHQAFVYLLVAGQVRRAEVGVLASVGADAVIRSGLSEGQEAIILGQYAVTPGGSARARRVHDAPPRQRFN
jgi:multidrug efflux pump subunit AcrA (membrane-fusion protein)